MTFTERITDKIKTGIENGTAFIEDHEDAIRTAGKFISSAGLLAIAAYIGFGCGKKAGATILISEGLQELTSNRITVTEF